MRSFRKGRPLRSFVRVPPLLRRDITLTYSLHYLPLLHYQRPPQGSSVTFVRSCSSAPSSRYHTHLLTSLPPPAPSADTALTTAACTPSGVRLLCESRVFSHASMPATAVGRGGYVPRETLFCLQLYMQLLHL